MTSASSKIELTDLLGIDPPSITSPLSERDRVIRTLIRCYWQHVSFDPERKVQVWTNGSIRLKVDADEICPLDAENFIEIIQKINIKLTQLFREKILSATLAPISTKRRKIMSLPPLSPYAASPPPPYSPMTGKDVRTPGRMPTPMRGPTPGRSITPHKHAHFKREVIEDVFRRYGWVNSDNGTWKNRSYTLHIPPGPNVSRFIAKTLMDEARMYGTKLSTPVKSPQHRYLRQPLHDTNGRSPLSRGK